MGAPTCITSTAMVVDVCRYMRVDTESLAPEVLSVPQYLRFKERLAGVAPASEPWTLEIDLGPFEARFPKMTRWRTIPTLLLSSVLDSPISPPLFSFLPPNCGYS